MEKAGGWNQRCTDKINEIPGETFRRAGKEFSIHNRSCNEHNSKCDRRKMKTNDSWYIFGRCRVIAYVIRTHPVFIAPNITQQHQHEPGEIKNEFFDRNSSADGWYFQTESGRFIWENEESVAKQQIEQETQRR